MIDKPTGMTSFGVVARVRRVLSERAQRKVKVGHAGTLDPFATGLLILCIGSECKNAGKYMKHDKAYEAVIHLGQTSTTMDPEGELSDVSDRVPTRDEIEQVLSKFSGEITQTPPIYSAVKIAGKRAYKRARDGEDIDMPQRTITVYSVGVESYEYPRLKIRANVSSGTYIRSLASDIGKDLGVGAYCKELRRLSIGEWQVSDATTLAEMGVTD